MGVQVEALMMKNDSNNDGKLSLNEFLKMMVPEPSDPFEDAIECPLKKQRFRFARNLCEDFKRTDVDDSGFIEISELEAYYTKRANESGLHVKQALEGIKRCGDILKDSD